MLKPGGHYQGTMLSKRDRNSGLGREIAPDTFISEAWLTRRIRISTAMPWS